ncbi:MAG: NAD(P)/FAD-dependent oxidoreductase [Methanobacteriota archaeon]
MSDVAIVGAGPAGLTAAIYLARNDIDAALLERNLVGGLARNANLIEDYPGFPEGISGPELCKRLEGQLSSIGVLVIDRDVEEISRKGADFVLRTNAGSLEAKTLIIATGTRPEELAAKGAEKAEERIFYEVAEMDGLAAGESIAVIGGGEAALDYALTLHNQGCAPEVFCRGEAVKTNPRLMARFAQAGIPLRLDASLTEVRALRDHLELALSDGTRHRFARILAALGRAPSLPVLGEGMPEKFTIAENGQTQIQGLFMAGDVRRGRDRHLATAVGDGMRAAMLARQHLETPEAKG